ncbi:LysE family transporter [Acinetobacter sp. DSM 11652]|uniref:LysE family transporter n=1 Tax=Acinetobacter sp. DSM 11652 TaxID=346222 RepID=UPI0008CA2864|nr:LysE family transporter [Acinetobacter sp. DSM 11652]SEL45933.1 threonine efflux protein [Acinetobacter sp. DSM 11652]
MSPLFSLAIIHFFALISPGPDFLFVTQSAVRQSRIHALFAALGISLSILVWAICAMSGLHYLFQKMAWLQTIMMILGGVYLIYLGIQLCKSGLTKSVAASVYVTKGIVKKKYSSLLIQGFLTNMANPKALVYFSSVFALAMNSDATLIQQSSLLMLIFVESLIWFAIVAFIFSAKQVNTIYQKISKKIDLITGSIFISFGCFLIFNRD